MTLVHNAGDPGMLAWANGIDANKLDVTTANSTFVDLLAGAGTSEYQARAFAANGASALSLPGWFPVSPSVYRDIYSDKY